MAKQTRKLSFTKASINFEEMTITETTKDECKEYDLAAILKDWDGIPGISLTFSQDDEVPSKEE